MAKLVRGTVTCGVALTYHQSGFEFLNRHQLQLPLAETGIRAGPTARFQLQS